MNKLKAAFKYTALAGITLLALSSCASRPAVPTLNPGQEFTLSIGQSVSITGEQLEIKFLDIIGDSR